MKSDEKTPTLSIAPLNATDIAEITNEPHPYRITGLTARLDGKVIAIGGHSHLPDGSLLAFAWLTDEARKRKVWLHRQALRMLKDMARTGRRVVATASPDVGAAERWLGRLGFREMGVTATNGAMIWILDRDAQ